MPVKRFSLAAAIWAATALMSGCAVGPDFTVPAAPDLDRYTREPQPARTAATGDSLGASQHFAPDRDIPGDWWTLFRSRGLNALIAQSLEANPNLQSAVAALRVAQENKLAQVGKFFPTIQANFTPTRQLTAQSIAPVLNSGENPFNLYTAQVMVSYPFDFWG